MQPPVFSFQTLSVPAEALFKEQGSRFLAFAFPVSSEPDIKTHLAALRKKYYDATHHCYAWVLGADKSRYRANDDGEPNHTAGDPILGQIRAHNLTHVLIVVVRYFGGTKLGVGGLAQAYKAASAAVLANAVIVEREVTCSCSIRYAYTSTPEVMSLVKEFDLKIQHQDFSDAGFMQVILSLRNRDDFVKRLELLRALGHPIAFDEGIGTK
ncbi:MAG: YigZ family protein [Cyclobacteriaceae bacterium]|nr:YigZ family protein [Cyclobacteriaceae bacterium]